MKWTAEQLNTIVETGDLFVSPFREDGTTNGTPTRTWALVVVAGTYYEAAIYAAYEAKYAGSSAVPIMQGDGPKSASIRISPR